MKVSVDAKEFFRALGVVERVAGMVRGREKLPITLKAKGMQLAVLGRSESCTVEHTIGADVKRSGECAVRSPRLKSFVGALKDSVQLVVQADKTKISELRVSQGRRWAKLATDGRTTSPLPESGEDVVVDAKPFLAAVARVAFAIGEDESRLPALTCLHIVPQDEVLVFQATDAHRFARRVSEIPSAGWPAEGVLIPRELATELERLVPRNEKLRLSFCGEALQLSWGATRLKVRTVQGTFPDLAGQLEKQKVPTTVEVEGEDFLLAMRRSQCLLTKDTEGVTLSSPGTGGQLGLQSWSPLTGRYAESVAAKLSGSVPSWQARPRYLSDAVRAAAPAGGQVRISMGDDSTAALIRNVDDPEGGLWVVMPMRG